MKSLLKDKYPDITVVGTHYPVPPSMALLVQALTVAQLTLIAFVLMGDKIIAADKLPEWVANMQAQKMSTCMVIWFAGNMANSMMGNTGAFEIGYGGQVVFSKMATGRMPSIQEIFENIEQIRNGAR